MLPSIQVKDLNRFEPRYSLGQDDGQGSKHFLRIKVTEGAITSDQLREVAHLSDEYGRGRAWVTDRQSIQLHWIEDQYATEIFSRLERIGFTTDKCGQAYPGARYGDVRNICACPVAGFEKSELIDVRPLARQLNEFFIGNKDFLDMPKKFKISISACQIDCARAQMQDLGLFALSNRGDVGFGAVVGGALGVARPGAVIGKPLEVFIQPQDVFEVAKNMAEIHRDYSSRESKMKARFKWLVNQWGVKKLRDKLEEKLSKKFKRIDYSGPRVSGEEHVGPRKQKNGKYYLTIPLLGGRLSSENLRILAGVARRYGSGHLRTTPYQNLILLNIPQEKLEKAQQNLSKEGLSPQRARLYFESVACADEFCANSAGFHSKKVLREIVEYLEDQFKEEMDGLKIKIGISGCPRGCGLHRVADIGLLGRSAGKRIGQEKYRCLVGGRFGTGAKFGQVLHKRKKVEEIKPAIGNLIASCLEEGYGNFQHFLDAHPLHELKKIFEL